MKEKKKTLKIVMIVIPIMILIIILGFTYAYWLTTNTQKDENIVDTLKCLETTLTDETSAINLSDAYPLSNAEGMASTPYTFTIKNNCTTYVSTDITLEVLSTTNLNAEYVRTSLQSAGSIIDNSKLLNTYKTGTATITGATSYKLKSNFFFAPNEANVYDLRLWLDENTPETQMNKSFSSKIVVISSPIKPTLADTILSLYGGKDEIMELPVSSFSKVAVSQEYYDTLDEITSPKQSQAIVENGLFKTTDEDGASYYFRGGHNLNNNVIFAGFQWKIIRITGTNAVKLIYNGICSIPECAINTTQFDTQLYANGFNGINSDNRYVGYMYGTDISDYQSTHTNTTSSTIKGAIDTWYENNILNKGTAVTSKIADIVFCNDRQPSSSQSTINGVGGASSIAPTYYGAYVRLVSTIPHSLSCVQDNDRFTVSAEIGNGQLVYPIGLITADEIAIAGGKYNITNSNFYLYTSRAYWTMSPYYMSGVNAYSGVVFSNGSQIGRFVTDGNGIRPVIALKTDTKISGGNGSATNPYVIQ